MNTLYLVHLIEHNTIEHTSKHHTVPQALEHIVDLCKARNMHEPTISDNGMVYKGTENDLGLVPITIQIIKITA